MSIARRRFRIIKEIAEGGFGKVYLAEQISSDGFSRIVAIKLLHAKWSTHDEVVKRTRDEARVLGRIRHQHIVKVEDLTSIESKCAIVMEYLEGVDLKWMSSFLKERGLEFPRGALFEIVLAVASALDAAYNSIPLQGDQPLKAIHRDIKPSNIFVTVAGGVKVLDFGTARANFAEREAKTQALAFGSQGYMAPERMLGEEDTPAADIFSLGITLYELLTLDSFGRIPPRPNKFQKKIEEKVAAVPLQGDPDWVGQVRDTLRVMLSYTPGERPTAAQLVEIMDLLAQDAGDTGLRRYCRTLVSEAKDALPVLDTGDALTGTIVDEDEFTGPPAENLASASLPPQPAPSTLPPSTGMLSRSGNAPATGRQQSAAGNSRAAVIDQAGRPSESVSSPNAPVTGTLPPPPPPVRTVNPNAGAEEQVSTFSQRPLATAGRTSSNQGDSISREGSLDGPAPLRDPSPPPHPVPTRSSPWRWVGVAVFALLLVVAGIGMAMGLTTTGVVAYIWGTGPDTDTRVDARNGTAPVPPVVPPPPPPPVKGSEVITPDSRADKKTVPTVLSYGDPKAGAEIEIKGPGGYHAKWDGKAPFDLGKAGDGRYTCTISAPNNLKFRLRMFTVEPGKASCKFSFDLTKAEWLGGCQ